MSPTTFLIGLTALVAFKVAARLGVRSGRFDNLPRPHQLD